MGDIPYVAFGDDELEAASALTAGDEVGCPHCGGQHTLTHGTENGTPSHALQFYKCGDKTYLAGVNGKSVMGRFEARVRP